MRKKKNKESADFVVTTLRLQMFSKWVYPNYNLISFKSTNLLAIA